MENIQTIRFSTEDAFDDENVPDEIQLMEFVQDRGYSKTQVITMNSKMIDLNFEFTQATKIYLTIDEKNINLRSHPSSLKILWINAWQTIEGPNIDFKSYMESKLVEEDPEILIISSSSRAYPGWMAARDINKTGTWKTNHFGPVGMDGSGFCVATKSGVIAGRGNDINSAMCFTYAHYI